MFSFSLLILAKQCLLWCSFYFAVIGVFLIAVFLAKRHNINTQKTLETLQKIQIYVRKKHDYVKTELM